MKKENIILSKSFNFALEIITIYKILISDKEFIISKQLLRSGTSIGANINESVSAESKKDFLHKLTIGLKEARETKYWLRLLADSKMSSVDLTKILELNEEIIKILVAITKTSKNH